MASMQLAFSCLIFLNFSPVIFIYEHLSFKHKGKLSTSQFSVIIYYYLVKRTFKCLNQVLRKSRNKSRKNIIIRRNFIYKCISPFNAKIFKKIMTRIKKNKWLYLKYMGKYVSAEGLLTYI